MNKKRLLLLLALILCIYISYGIRLFFFDFSVFSKELIPDNPSHFYDYRGATHVHSSKSSGTGDLFKIVRNAEAAQLDYIFITDTDDFSNDKSQEGYFDNLLLFLAAEYSYLDSKLLNFNRQSFEKFNSIGSAQREIADSLENNTNSSGGFYVLAHPSKKKYKWSGPYPRGLTGIEVVNLKSIWENAWKDSKASFIWSLLIYPFNPKLSLVRLLKPIEENFSLWERLNKKQKTIGMYGSNAEAKMFLGQQNVVSFPSYANLLSVGSNHLLLESELTGDFQADKQKISQAIREGQFFFSFDILQNPKGFETFIKDANEDTYNIGSEIKFSEGLELVVSLPKKPLVPTEIVIYKDGIKLVSSNSQQTTLSLHEPGNYRIVVNIKYKPPFPEKSSWIPWIYTNFFYLRN